MRQARVDPHAPGPRTPDATPDCRSVRRLEDPYGGGCVEDPRIRRIDRESPDIHIGEGTRCANLLEPGACGSDRRERRHGDSCEDEESATPHGKSLARTSQRLLKCVRGLYPPSCRLGSASRALDKQPSDQAPDTGTEARRGNGTRLAALHRTLAGSGRNVQGTAAPVHLLDASTLRRSSRAVNTPEAGCSGGRPSSGG